MQGLPKSRDARVAQNTTHFRAKGFGAPQHHQERKPDALRERNASSHVQRLEAAADRVRNR